MEILIKCENVLHSRFLQSSLWCFIRSNWYKHSQWPFERTLKLKRTEFHVSLLAYLGIHSMTNSRVAGDSRRDYQSATSLWPPKTFLQPSCDLCHLSATTLRPPCNLPAISRNDGRKEVADRMQAMCDWGICDFKNAAAISKRIFAGAIIISQVRFQNADTANLASFGNDGRWFQIQTGNSLRRFICRKHHKSNGLFFVTSPDMHPRHIYIYIYYRKHLIHSCTEPCSGIEKLFICNVWIYIIFFKPYYNYGILVWGYDCHRVEKIQKRIFRIITVSKYNAHTEPLLRLLVFSN